MQAVMIQHGSIVCGGGWKNRPRAYHIKFKAICCLILFFPAMAATLILAEWMGEWSLLLPSALVGAALLFLCFERPQVCWGPSDLRGLDLDQPVFGPRAGVSHPPKYDPHNLY